MTRDERERLDRIEERLEELTGAIKQMSMSIVITEMLNAPPPPRPQPRRADHLHALPGGQP